MSPDQLRIVLKRITIIAFAISLLSSFAMVVAWQVGLVDFVTVDPDPPATAPVVNTITWNGGSVDIVAAESNTPRSATATIIGSIQMVTLDSLVICALIIIGGATNAAVRRRQIRPWMLLALGSLSALAVALIALRWFTSLMW